MNTQKRKTDTSFGRSVIMIALALLSLSSCKPSHVSVPSPDGNLTLNLSQEKDSILISIDYKGERVISPSPIGFESSGNTFNCQPWSSFSRPSLRCNVLSLPFQRVVSAVSTC